MAVTEEQVREELKQVIDPELGIDIVNLGLVYTVEVDGGQVNVDMTLTYPGCPLGNQISDDVKYTVGRLDGVEDVDVRIVWEPRWTEDMMSDELKLMRRLGMLR